MLPRRSSRRRVALLVVGILLLLIAVAGISLTIRPAAESVPLNPGIPHEQALIAAGLSGTPGPGQPSAPVAVDRVLVDGAATYIQYHIIQPLGTRTDLFPTLTDNRGTSLNAGSGGISSVPDAVLPFPLPAWLPWHPMVSRRDVFIVYAPLPATARAAVVRFDGLGAHETVRVPLDLRALARRRLTHPGTTARAAGLTLTLRDLAFAHLIYTYAAPPNNAFTFVPARLLLADRAGHAVPVATINAECGVSASGSGSVTCDQRVVFSPQRTGTRLTLTIPAFTVYNAGGAHLLHGPWRLSFVVP